MPTKQVLIIGAGPYGLACAAQAKYLGIDYAVLGAPLEFWQHSMPDGMFLRAGSTWHIDPAGIYTLNRFLDSKGLRPEQIDPLPAGLFIEYVDWFVKKLGLDTIPSYVRRLERCEGGFDVFLDKGEMVTARNVVATPGLSFFRHHPADLVSKLPPGRYTHTCTMVNFEPLEGLHCLIIGGGQSAFEWAALMTEAGVAEVHLSYRHDTPQFIPSDWAWVDPLMEMAAAVRGWFRHLPAAERESIEKRFRIESRLKLEPWLAPRIRKPSINLWPHTSVESCKVSSNGKLSVRLSGGTTVAVDHIILATGYRVNVQQVSYLSSTSILPRLKTHDGFPALDEDFQTSVPGLFLTGLAATRDFGPFYGFVRGCPTAARMIMERIRTGLK
jgi:thioredoxin reductase